MFEEFIQEDKMTSRVTDLVRLADIYRHSVDEEILEIILKASRIVLEELEKTKSPDGQLKLFGKGGNPQ